MKIQKIQAMKRKNGIPQHFVYLPWEVAERACIHKGDEVECTALKMGEILIKRLP